MSATRQVHAAPFATPHVERGFYRHHRDGDVYYVHGVAANPHDSFRRVVVYTSVKTEELGEPGQPPYDYLWRDEAEFMELISPSNEAVPVARADDAAVLLAAGHVPRFGRVTRVELGRLPDPAAPRVAGEAPAAPREPVPLERCAFVVHVSPTTPPVFAIRCEGLDWDDVARAAWCEAAAAARCAKGAADASTVIDSERVLVSFVDHGDEARFDDAVGAAATYLALRGHRVAVRADYGETPQEGLEPWERIAERPAHPYDYRVEVQRDAPAFRILPATEGDWAKPPHDSFYYLARTALDSVPDDVPALTSATLDLVEFRCDPEGRARGFARALGHACMHLAAEGHVARVAIASRRAWWESASERP